MDRRREVVERLTGGRLVAVLRTPDAESAAWLGEHLIRLRWPSVEVTWTIPGAAGVLRHLVDLARGSETLLGAGTMRGTGQAFEAIAAGASYLVSPARPVGLAALAHNHDLPVVLGAMTPHEVHEALEGGADFVKLFPIHRVGGPAYVRDLLAPFPDLRALVSGGIEPDDVAAHLDAGAAVVSLGQTLTPGHARERRDEAVLAECVHRALQSAGLS
ncbi:MAG: bifunctional 4-hydroxy-2-oxoglutarate aldolase/2-dehydro-3-deoxy-phosphogluconate aldolase [Candidatus Sericytochromatia bacterium]|nr:bifunctional 4-hydroxy-2-oxoglutarate aldolase/2-dehydro-3-deoxy-phosphogluconate aldolase [Candidatus Sericytochromatia bacterium]